MKSEGVSLTRDSPPVTSSCNIVNKPITIIKHNNNNNNSNQQQKVINNNNNNNNNKRHICPKCGLLINSVESLKVHMQYQHEDMSRWGVPSSVPPTGQSIVPITPVPSTTSSSSSAVQSSISVGTTNSDGGGGNTNNTGSITAITNQSSRSSPTDTENNNNNNQPSSKHHQLQQYTTGKTDTTSPLLHSSNNTNSTVSAAADSSDNQPSTPQPSSIVTGTGSTSSSGGGSSGVGGSGGSCNEQQSTPHSYTGTTNSPYHQAQGNNILSQEMHPYPAYMHGYDQFYHPPPGMDYAQTTLYPGNQASAPHQEYKLVPSSRYHPYLNNSSHMQQQQQMPPLHTNSGNTNGNNTTSSTISNSSLSPRVVSSSSPTQNSIIGQTGGQDSSTMSQISQGQPTPSPSPKQCDKCGMVCQTDAQLSEHYTTAHGVPQQSNDAINRSGGDDNDIQSQYSYQPYIKEEPSSDILDLDSQKMVYPPTHDSINQEPLPPMHSMHPMHRPLMWGAEMHTGYMPHSQTDLKQPYYSPIKQPYPTIKQEYAAMKQPDYPTGTGFGGQMIKSEFNAHHQTIAPQTRADIKSFGTDITSGNNPVSSSPSEFPSTTTPQDNGPQFRGFEPPTSSLPNNPPSTKSATWKSNEARRPKTYNCTACNKWFTSSGHLKRHYNTTLHKNAVKSSGQPDPATMPISAHHHPSRDPNSKHHRNSQSQQPPPAPPEPPRSPEYTPQYTPPPGGFTQPQSFQQYNTTIHSASNGHPNGQAGPSVHASQPRGLLIISTMEATSNLEQEDQVQHNQQHHHQREEQYHHQQILEEHLNPNLEHQQPGHIISMSPHHQHQDTISTTPTTTTIRNTMDQQQYIISPLAINTTTTNIIPSFQHLQHPAEHLQSYHTIIGNDSNITNNDTDHLLQFDSFDMPLPQHQQIQLATIHHLQTTTDGQQVSTITALNPSIVELHRLSGGVATYRENTAMPFSPVVPESYLRSAPSNCERSPQEADVAPNQSSAQPPTSFPYSPTISSTVTTTASSTTTQKKPAPKRKKTISTSSSSAPSSNSSSVTTSPSGKIECIECGKEFAKSCYLTQHNKTFHSGEQPFRCQKCGKRFQCQETYDTHLAKHKAQDKPYKCDKCPKQFHHKTDLRRHRDGHTGYKAHVCDTCSKGFCRKDHLRKHSDTHKPKPTKKKITA